MPLEPASTRADPVARTLQWIALGVMAFVVLDLLGDVLLLLFAACLLASIMLAASRFVARHTRLGRRFALGLMLVAAAAIVFLFAWFGAGGVVWQASSLAADLQERLLSLQNALQHSPWGNEALQQAHDYLSARRMAGMASGIATSTLGLAGTLVLLIVAAIYIAISPGLYREGTVRLLPIAWRPRGFEVMDALGETLVWWFLGQLVDMVVIGLLTYAGLSALGVPLPGTLAVIAGVTNFVPYIGVITGSVPAVLVALGQSTELAIEVAALVAAVQALEGNVIAPLVQRRTVELPPLVTILSQTVFGTLFGIGGLILATPIAAALLVLVRMVYIGDVLGDREAAGRPEAPGAKA